MIFPQLMPFFIAALLFPYNFFILIAEWTFKRAPGRGKKVCRPCLQITWWRDILLIHSPPLYLPPEMGSCNLMSDLPFLFFFCLQSRGYQNLVDRSHLCESTWKSNEYVIYFCIEIGPQILPSSDAKPALEWRLLCILNYKSCNLHKSDNSSQLQLKHFFSTLQAIPLREKIAVHPLTPIALPPIHPMVSCRLGLPGKRSHISGWKISLTLWNQPHSTGIQIRPFMTAVGSHGDCFSLKPKFILFCWFALLLKKRISSSQESRFWSTPPCPNTKLTEHLWAFLPLHLSRDLLRLCSWN